MSDIVSRANAAVCVVDRRTVANEFVASLSSRRLELRSALGSFAVLQHFPQYTIPRQRDACPVCGVYNRGAERKDLNVLNFERFKWGGVRHDKPLYASLDLQLFQELSRIDPTAGDVAVFKDLLQAIESTPVTKTSATLESISRKVFKSNKAERDNVVGILGLMREFSACPRIPVIYIGSSPIQSKQCPDDVLWIWITQHVGGGDRTASIKKRLHTGLVICCEESLLRW